MLSVCSERPHCPELDEKLWFCQLHSQNRKRLCKSSCMAPRSLWKNTDNRYESMALNTNQGQGCKMDCDFCEIAIAKKHIFANNTIQLFESRSQSQHVAIVKIIILKKFEIS